MNHKFKLFLTTAVLYSPAVFGNSSIEFESCRSFQSSVSFQSCQSFSGEESIDSRESFSMISHDDAKETGKKDSNFQRVLAQHVGSAVYQALYPKMKNILWMELNKLLNGTGMVVLTPDGQKLPVLKGSFDGLFDLILSNLGLNSSICSGVKLAATISGHKGYIESELKRLLGLDSLEKLAERLAQEMALKAMGIAVESYYSTDYSTKRSLTLSEIANVQQSISMKDGRSDVLSERAQNADLRFATGYVWYELKNIINKLVATSIDAHLAELRASTVRVGKEKLDAVVKGVAFGIIIVNGIAGVIPVAGMLAISHKFDSTVVEAGYDLFNQTVTDGLLEVRDIAVLPISESEIEQFHAETTTVDTTDEEDTVVVHSVKEASFRGSFLLGAASTTAANVVGSVKSGVSSMTKKLTSWFRY